MDMYPGRPSPHRTRLAAGPRRPVHCEAGAQLQVLFWAASGGVTRHSRKCDVKAFNKWKLLAFVPSVNTVVKTQLPGC